MSRRSLLLRLRAVAAVVALVGLYTFFTTTTTTPDHHEYDDQLLKTTTSHRATATLRTTADVKKANLKRIALDIDDSQLDDQCKPFLADGPLGPHAGPMTVITPNATELLLPALFRAPSAPPRTIFFTSAYAEFPTDALIAHTCLCAVEAAALLNPTYAIEIYTPNPANLESAMDARWGMHAPFRPRVRAVYFDWPDIFQGTPFEEWYRSGGHRETPWVAQQLANGLRLAILWKKGGTYFDLDVISTNPLPAPDAVRRAVGMQHLQDLNNAVMTFPPRDPLVWLFMEEFVFNFQGKVWGWHGPYLLTRVVEHFCPTLNKAYRFIPRKISPNLSVVPDPKKDFEGCEDLVIYAPDRLYAIGYTDRGMLEYNWRHQCRFFEQFRTRSIAVHLWNAKAAERQEGETVRSRVLERSCPFTDPMNFAEAPIPSPVATSEGLDTIHHHRPAPPESGHEGASSIHKHAKHRPHG